VEVAGFRSAMANKVMDTADRYIELDLLADKFRKEVGGEDDVEDYREKL
jgi:hypothetical protein